MKYIVLVLSLILSLFSSGCSGIFYPKNNVTVRVKFHASKEFTAPERAVIDYQALEWAKDTNGQAQIIIDYTGIVPKLASQIEANLIRFDSENPEVKFTDIMAGCEGCILGWTFPLGGVHTNLPEDLKDNRVVALIMDRYSDINQTGRVIRHEFGHMLGMSHIPDPYALMYPYDNPSQSAKACLTKPDISEFCRVNKCSIIPEVSCGK